MARENLAGRSFPPSTPHLVTAEELSQFAAQFGGTGCWPTFAISMAAPAWLAIFDDPDLGLDLAKTVHADQRFACARPLRAGDSVVATATITKDRTRGATKVLTVEVLLTVANECVVTATSTLITEVGHELS